MMFRYRITEVYRVVDGDTYDLKIDLGFYQYGVYRFRLLGWDTPEVYGRYASEGGKEAKAFVERWFEEHHPDTHVLDAASQKADSFGRWLAAVFCNTCQVDLGESLHTAGHATPYP